MLRLALSSSLPTAMALLRLFVGLVVVLSPISGFAHEVFVIGTTGVNSGDLRIVRFAERNIPVYLVLCQGGSCLFAGSNPGFAGDPAHGELTEQDLAAEGLFPLPERVEVWLEVVEIVPEVKIGFGRIILERGGASRVLLGTGPGLHNHPSWRLILPEGRVGAFRVVFRLTTTTPGFRASPDYTVWVTNASEPPTPSPTLTATPTPTLTSTPTTPPTHTATATVASTETALPTASFTASATLTPSPTEPPPSPSNTSLPTATERPQPTPTQRACVGDCNDDGEVTIDEIVFAVSVALGTSEVSGCLAADRNEDGTVTVDEIVAAVNAALLGCRFE